MSQKNLQKGLEWLNKEIKKDELDLERDREEFIQQLKAIKKEDMFPKKQKISIWQRLKKVMGF
jgi:hypothetical protein